MIREDREQLERWADMGYYTLGWHLLEIDKIIKTVPLCLRENYAEFFSNLGLQSIILEFKEGKDDHRGKNSNKI